MDNEKSYNENLLLNELLDYRSPINRAQSFANSTNFTSLDFINLLNETSAAIACFSFSEEVLLNKNDLTLDKLLNNDIEINFINKSFSELLFKFKKRNRLTTLKNFFPSDKSTLQYLSKWQKSNFSKTYIDIPCKVDGASKVFEFILYPINGNKKNIIKKSWIVCHDVSSSRKLINKISNQEKHFRKLLEQPGLMLLRISKNEELLYLSNFLIQILGYTDIEFKENLNSITKLIHPDDIASFRELKLARKSKRLTPVCIEYRIKNKNQEYLWLYHKQIPKKDFEGNIEYYDSVILDINERKKLEQSLLHSQRMEVVGQMATQVAHDFNNHLTTILGQLTLAIQNINDKDKLKTSLKDAEKATLACGEISKNLLSFGKKNINRNCVINFANLLEDTSKLARNSIPSSIKLSLSIGLGIKNVVGNYTELQQVLLNLILNAKDAIYNKGNIHIAVNNCDESCIEAFKRKNLLDPSKEYLVIIVKDDGCGISENNQKYIFDPYFSTKSELSNKHLHSGLGLSSVYSIVKEHNGAIEVNSKLNKGSEFKFFLPSSKKVIKNKNLDNKLYQSKKTFCILLADDDRMLSNITSTLLSSNGHKIIHANNGEEAISLYKKNKKLIDLALIDYTMPILNGREVIDYLHKTNKDLPIILTSGLSNFALKDNKNIKFLSKPYHIDHLNEKISDFFN